MEFPAGTELSGDNAARSVKTVSEDNPVSLQNSDTVGNMIGMVRVGATNRTEVVNT